MDRLKVLVISGSSRSGSFNARLAAVAARLLAEAGAEVSTLDLRALALPVYDGDIEAASGPPEGAKRLRDALAASDALFVSTPEYNGFPTPLLINAFDWMSRVPAEGGLPAGLGATAGKPVGLVSASPGPLGGLRSLNTLRAYLQMAFQGLVVPTQFALGRAGEAFDAEGGLRDEKSQAALAGVVRTLLQVAGALQAARGG